MIAFQVLVLSTIFKANYKNSLNWLTIDKIELPFDRGDG